MPALPPLMFAKSVVALAFALESNSCPGDLEGWQFRNAEAPNPDASAATPRRAAARRSSRISWFCEAPTLCPSNKIGLRPGTQLQKGRSPRRQSLTSKNQRRYEASYQRAQTQTTRTLRSLAHKPNFRPLKRACVLLQGAAAGRRDGPHRQGQVEDCSPRGIICG